MADADINFYFDPVCPLAWVTSKWVRLATTQRDYTVDWRFISPGGQLGRSTTPVTSRPAIKPGTPQGSSCCEWPLGSAPNTVGKRSVPCTRRSAPKSSTPDPTTARRPTRHSG
jgi:hypothetical protein